MNLKLALINSYLSPTLPSIQVNVKAKIIQQESRAQLCSRWNLSPEYHLHQSLTKVHLINLTVWNDDSNITIGHWYLFPNVSIRQFKGRTFISITKDTELTARL